MKENVPFPPYSLEDYVDSRSALPPDLEKPDCAKGFELPYSIHAFQHLRVSKGQTSETLESYFDSSWQGYSLDVFFFST